MPNRLNTFIIAAIVIDKLETNHMYKKKSIMRFQTKLDNLYYSTWDDLHYATWKQQPRFTDIYV